MPYNPGFIKGHKVPLPVIKDELLIAPLKGMIKGTSLDYLHHSVVMNKKRRFAFYSASNIDGLTWQPVERKGIFKKDERMDSQFQFGDELYGAISGGGRKNDFDEGHITSYQEVLWGKKVTERKQAGNETFFFTNCVPQHGLLNRGAWKSLEQFVTKTGANDTDIAVSVFSGPLFKDNDPFYIKKIEGKLIRIPTTFWKVIHYQGRSGLSAVGFMMDHGKLLLEEETVTFDKAEVQERGLEEVDIFQMFPKATTYQVKVELIEKLTKFDFHLKNLNLPYKKNDSKEIVFKRIEIERTGTRGIEEDNQLDFKLDGLTL